MKLFYQLFLFLFLYAPLYSQSNIQFTSACEDLNFDYCQVSLVANATTDCSVGTFLIVNYQIDEYNNGIIDAIGSSFDASGIYPHGSHRIIFTVTDQCNNTATCEYLFTIVDEEPPFIDCPIGAVGFFASSNVLIIHASELYQNSTDNCTASNDLLFSFSSDTNDNLDTLTCMDFELCDGSIHVRELWITDEAGNQNHCNVYILINNVSCGCVVDIFPMPPEFHVVTEEEEDILGYQVNRNGTIANDPGPLSYWNFNLGDFISIEKSGNPINGVTTFDLVLISKHILGTLPLDTPLKILAADADGSGTVTTFDVVLLRRLILQIDDDFPDGKSWVFDPPFIEQTPGFFEFHFEGRHKGDVNGSANPEQHNNTSTEVRTTDEITFFTDNVFLQKGKSYTLPIYVSNYNNIIGGQFSLSFNQDFLELVEIKSNSLPSLDDGNFGMTQIDDGLVLCSWHSTSPERLGGTDSFFEVEVTVNEDCYVKEMLDINSKILNAEAYSENNFGEVRLLNVNWNVLDESSEVLSVTPNPFNFLTNIVFTNKKSGPVNLVLYDLSGKRIISKTKNMEKGNAQFFIHNRELPSKGIYFYEIKTSETIYTGKLIMQ